MADESVWKSIHKLKDRMDRLEKAHDVTVSNYDENFEKISKKIKQINFVVDHNFSAIDDRQDKFENQLNALRVIVDDAPHVDSSAKFAKVWLAIGFGSVAALLICRKMRKIENRVDAIEEDVDKR